MWLRLRWLGVSCFEMVLPSGRVLLTDPFLDKSPTSPVKAAAIAAADYMCLTHGHWDHIMDVGNIAGRCGSRIVCSAEVAQTLVKEMGVDRSQIRTATAGDRFHYPDLQIEVVRGLHVDLSTLNLKSGPDLLALLKDPWPDWPGGEQLNFVFQMAGNVGLYLMASFPYPSLREVARGIRAQVFMPQLMQGFEEEAAEMAALSGAGLVLPVHHDELVPGWPVPDLDKFQKELATRSAGRFEYMVPGKWYLLDTTLIAEAP